MYRRDEDQSPCFGEYFEQYLNSSGLELPLPNQTIFNQYISDFVQTRSFAGIDPRDFKGWFGTETNAKWNDSSSSIVWFKQVVYTQVNRNWGGSAMYEYYEKWEDFIGDFNSESPDEFQGIQTASAYIRMEVEVAFLDGFVKSVMYTIILCSAVMVFFTQNFYLVFLVILYIIIICVWIVGVFGAMGWPFSIIEIISVPTVVGLTIDYALHITHAYIHSPFPDRLRRAKSAVNDLGSSIFASAMTTVSSMVILYFAVIIIFSDLGWVVGVTTSFGVMLALFVCPPCLMYTGPQYDQCHITWFCPNSINGIKIGKHRFCSNQWHGVARAPPKQHVAAIELQLQEDVNSESQPAAAGSEGINATSGNQPASNASTGDQMDFAEDSHSMQKIKAEQERIMREIERQNNGGPPAPAQGIPEAETSVSMDYNPDQ